MKYLPDQSPARVKLDRERVLLIMKALRDYAPKLVETAPHKLRVLRAFAKTLPRELPYEVTVYPLEWDILSPALRPQGSNPVAGTEAARMYGVYSKLRPHCRFLTLQMVEREKTAERQRKARVWRGDFDHMRNKALPPIAASRKRAPKPQ